MPAQIFKGRVIAAAGPLPGQFTIENLKRWTSLRKGVFIEDLGDDVTHLLCTREQFDKKVPRIKEALKRGKRLHIVHCDWFEFSTVNNKREPEIGYSMRSILAKQNAKKRDEARAEKGKRDGEKFVNTTLYHIYRDRSNFVYQIDLTRDDQDSGELGQKYTLYLWESNAKPHLYWFTAKFIKRRGNTQPTYHRPSIYPGKWRVHMDQFMQFFRTKTGIPWEDRVTLAMTMPGSYFQYAPPTGGKPLRRRLRFDSEYCKQINAELLGLPWPPVEKKTEQDSADDAGPEDGPVIFGDEDEDKTSPHVADGQAPDEHRASTSNEGGDEMEPENMEVDQELQTPIEDVEAEGADDGPVSPVPVSFDNTSSPAETAESTAPSSQGNENGNEQPPEEHIGPNTGNAGNPLSSMDLEAPQQGE
ncbi:hypothetical protein FDECE_14664 [Fusarium decemcellulare]|nr:hypothetical protein FDECE_14664 [Fusarium decemcellulare]